jgi:hypothetical protein
MSQPEAAMLAQRYNAGIEHPTVSVAMRHFARRSPAFQVSRLIDKLTGLDSFPVVSVGNLIEAAALAGLPVRGYGMHVGELDQLPLPALVYLKRSPDPQSPLDLVQIERLGPSKVVVSSDRFGTNRIPRAQLEEQWAGIVLLPDLETAPAGSDTELESYRSQVSVIPGFISKAECEELIAYCENSCFRRSRVAQREGKGRTDIVSASVRSSSSVVLKDRDHPILARLYRECAAREGVTPRHIETIQCVRYKRGQRFKAHFDGGLNLPRLTTYLLYLNDSYEGGETFFPMLNQSVLPVAGNCLRFPSCDRDGRILWPSEHGGLPVSSGIKYALNIWVRCPDVRLPS